MKILSGLLLLVTLTGCATEQQNIQKKADKAEASESTSTTAAYGGKCAMSLCHKKDVQGDPRYNVEYKGQKYLFSSEEARDKFLLDIEGNIKKADQHWGTFADKSK